MEMTMANLINNLQYRMYNSFLEDQSQNVYVFTDLAEYIE